MKKGMRIIGIIVLLAVIAIGMTACKGDSASGDKAAAKSGNEVDDLLADYEKFIDEYSTVLKKATSGDLSALADIQKWQTTLTEWSTRMDGLADKITPAQAAKFATLSEKFASGLGN